MVRASKSQLTLLEDNLARGDGQVPAAVRASRRRDQLPENQLEAQILDFLRWRGFISHRMHVGVFTPYRSSSRCRLANSGRKRPRTTWSASARRAWLTGFQSGRSFRRVAARRKGAACP